MKNSIIKIGLDVTILLQPLLTNYKNVNLKNMNLHLCDVKLLEYLIVSLQFESDLFRDIMEVLTKIFISTSI